MRVLVAHSYYQQPGGEDSVFEQEVALLREHGHEVHTYIRRNDEIKDYGPAARLMILPRTVWSATSKYAFGQILDILRPEVVHFHNTFPLMSPSVYAACKERHIAVVQTLHNFRLACPA